MVENVETHYQRLAFLIPQNIYTERDNNKTSNRKLSQCSVLAEVK